MNKEEAGKVVRNYYYHYGILTNKLIELKESDMNSLQLVMERHVANLYLNGTLIYTTSDIKKLKDYLMARIISEGWNVEQSAFN